MTWKLLDDFDAVGLDLDRLPLGRAGVGISKSFDMSVFLISRGLEFSLPVCVVPKSRPTMIVSDA